MEYKVVYTVEYTKTIKLEPGQTLADAVSDIEIPEGDGSKYIEESFDVLSVTDSTGKDASAQLI